MDACVCVCVSMYACMYIRMVWSGLVWSGLSLPLSRSLSMSLSLRLSLCLSLCLFLPVSGSVSASSLCLSLCLCLYVSVCVCLCLSVPVYVCLCLSLSVSACLCLSLSVSVYVSVSKIWVGVSFLFGTMSYHIRCPCCLLQNSAFQTVQHTAFRLKKCQQLRLVLPRSKAFLKHQHFIRKWA